MVHPVQFNVKIEVYQTCIQEDVVVQDWIIQGVRIGRMDTPTLKTLISCRSTWHAARERVRGFCCKSEQQQGGRLGGEPS